MEPISTENEPEALEDAPEPQIIRDSYGRKYVLLPHGQIISHRVKLRKKERRVWNEAQRQNEKEKTKKTLTKSNPSGSLKPLGN